MKIVESNQPPHRCKSHPPSPSTISAISSLLHFCNTLPHAILQYFSLPPPPPPHTHTHTHTHTFTPTSSISSSLIAQNHYSGEELQKSVKMKTLKSRHGDARISQCTTWRLVNVIVCSTFPSKRIGKLYVDKSSYVCFLIK